METQKPNVAKILEARAKRIEQLLDHLLDPDLQPTGRYRPHTLLKAMRHGLLSPGKRIRPFLVMESTHLAQGDTQTALGVAAALECVHCYSLIHDDLPAMDNDDVRRGLPTVHRAFDEATAILAGDSLLTFAFEIIADPEITPATAECRAELILSLSRAAGFEGMAGGQALDLESRTQSRKNSEKIFRLQSMKTGSLIKFACESGAIIAGSGNTDRKQLAEFGRILGLAFQISDDLLDVTSNLEKAGKATRKDILAKTATLISVEGVSQTREKLGKLILQAKKLIEVYGEEACLMKEFADFIEKRDF